MGVINPLHQYEHRSVHVSWGCFMKVLLTADQIQQRVREVAGQVENDYNNTPITIIGVLTGSLLFVADLIRHLSMPIKLGFVRASSYHGTATTPGKLTIDESLLPDLRGQHVLLLDDILDTGQTLARLKERLQPMELASLKIGVLLRKSDRREHDVTADYIAFEIPDEFVVGYGLDYNDEYRNLPYIGVLEL